MAKYILATCSTADISIEHMKNRQIEYIPFSYYLDGVEFKDDLGQSISFDSFYKKMKSGVETKTSQPNVEQYKEFLSNYLKQDSDIILLNLSSGISGAQTSARLACQELREEYPERKIYVVDSLGASGGMGLLVDKMADMRDAGMTIDELYTWTEENKLKVQHWFFSTDLTFYVKGGRVSKVAGWFGTILKICPLLNVDSNGKLIPCEKIRGKANVIKQIVNKMQAFARDGVDYDGKCYITHSDCYDDALAVANLIEESFPRLNGKVIINSIGTTIGSHTGPGTVALFFFGKERQE